jgi:hypothetical protein
VRARRNLTPYCWGLFWEGSRLPWDGRPPSSVSTHRSGAQVLADPHVPSLPTYWLLARSRQLDAAARRLLQL